MACNFHVKGIYLSLKPRERLFFARSSGYRGWQKVDMVGVVVGHRAANIRRRSIGDAPAERVRRL